MKSTDDDRLDRILRSRMSFSWPFRADVVFDDFKSIESDITDWVRSADRKGNINIYRSYATGMQVYFDNRDDWMEFCLRWK